MMKKADLTTVIKLVRENKCSQLEIIHLNVYTTASNSCS